MLDGALVDDVRLALREHADPARAAGQQAYMRSAMPFLGVRVPEVRRLATAAARAHPPADLASLEASARLLWDDAEHREERYAAAALCRLPLAQGRLELVGLYEHMARTGAWWDHVDELAHRVADLLDVHPDETAAILRDWSTSGDLWLERLAIIGQLGRGDRLDRALLADVVRPHERSTEPFLRKAIGWALREHARVDATWVVRFVQDRPHLSGLTRREALKHVG